MPLAAQMTASSSAFAALIWWVVPAAGLIGGISYVIWVTKFKRKFESETSRSVGQFQRFQESFRADSEPLNVDEQVADEPGSDSFENPAR